MNNSSAAIDRCSSSKDVLKIIYIKSFIYLNLKIGSLLLADYVKNAIQNSSYIVVFFNTLNNLLEQQKRNGEKILIRLSKLVQNAFSESDFV